MLHFFFKKERMESDKVKTENSDCLVSVSSEVLYSSLDPVNRCNTERTGRDPHLCLCIQCIQNGFNLLELAFPNLIYEKHSQ